MEFGKWLWRLVVTIIVIFLIVAGYRLSLLLFKTQTLQTPTIAQVSLLDGTVLGLDQVTVDQDLITVASSHEELSMSWNTEPAAAQLVIDPRKLPQEQQATALYKWLVGVPRDSKEEQEFCIRIPEVQQGECYRFSRTPKSDEPLSISHQAAETEELIPLVYPEMLISVEEMSDDQVSLFVTLKPYPEGTQNTVNQRSLFLQIRDQERDSSPPDGRSGALVGMENLRLNGYPFVQLFLQKGIAVTIEGIDRSSGHDVIYEVQTIPQLVEGAAPLKGSAVIPATSVLPSLPTLSFTWLGTDKTFLDQGRHLALDLSELGHDFSTRVTVESAFTEPVKVVVQLLDVSTTFSLTIAPSGSGEVMVNIKNLAYGDHKLQLNAVLPNGRKTADVVIPFVYRASGWYEAN